MHDVISGIIDHDATGSRQIYFLVPQTERVPNAVRRANVPTKPHRINRILDDDGQFCRTPLRIYRLDVIAGLEAGSKKPRWGLWRKLDTAVDCHGKVAFSKPKTSVSHEHVLSLSNA